MDLIFMPVPGTNLSTFKRLSSIIKLIVSLLIEKKFNAVVALAGAPYPTIFLLFFLIVTPIGLIVRLFGKDLLKTKFTKENTYWVKREKNIKKKKKQF